LAKQFDEALYPHKDLTERVIAAAIAVHKELGPGDLEQIYENALKIELSQRGHTVEQQVSCDVSYHGQPVGRHRLDLLVDDAVVLELKSVEVLVDTHTAQLRSTLKAARKRVGLLLNFNQKRLIDGFRRVIF
jgi:GxxExxY protein